MDKPGARSGSAAAVAWHAGEYLSLFEAFFEGRLGIRAKILPVPAKILPVHGNNSPC
jgi:hypothetical protein